MAVFKKALNKVIVPACVIFAAVITVISLFMLTLNFERPALLAGDILTIAFISLIFACLNLILHIKSLNIYIRMALHFIFTELALYLVLFLTTRSEDISTTVAGMRIYAVIFYAIIYVLVATVRIICELLRSSKKENEKKDKTLRN